MDSHEQTQVETSPPGVNQQPAASALTRALELAASAAGVVVDPRSAWEAAAAGMLEGRGDWELIFVHASRRAGLRAVSFEMLRTADVEALAELGAPAVLWLAGGGRGRWVVLTEARGNQLELALVDELGERRRRMSVRQLVLWLCEQADPDAPLRWLQVEARQPFVKLESTALLASLRPTEPSVAGRVSALRRLIAFARFEQQDLGVIVLYALAIGGATLAVPVAVQALVNTIALGAALQPLVVVTLLLLIGLGFVAVLQVLQAVVVEMIQRRLFVRVAADLARRLPRLAHEARERYHPPELVNRFFDVLTLQKAGAALLLDGLALALQTLVGMLLLGFYHPVLLAFDIALVIGLALLVLVIGRGAVASSENESTRKYALVSWLEDVAANPLRFSSPRARAFADARAEVLARGWLQARSTHFGKLMRQLVGGVGLQVLMTTALLGIGGWLVIQRQLTLGQLVAAELVMSAIGYGVGRLGKHLENLYDAATSAAKLGKLFDLPLERLGGELLTGSGPISLELRRAGEPVLVLEPGERLGLTGCSPLHGQLLDHLYGLDDRLGSGLRGPTGLAAEHDIELRGDGIELRLDGIELRALDREALREQVSLVRGCELLTGSVLDNLDGRPIPVDGQELRRVLELVGLRERIAALPEGLHTQLLPSGAPLREAEARRLVLARALLDPPRLLAIDGGLDALGLSPAQRAALLDWMFDPARPWTLIVVSDEPGLLARCDRRLNLERLLA